MSPVGYINVSLEIWGGVMSLVIGACMLVEHRVHIRRDRAFFRVLLCNAGALFSDAAAWLFKGHTGPIAWWGVRAANFLGFSMNFLLVIAFSLYLTAYLNERTRVAPFFPRLLQGVCLASILLLVVSQCNGMFYYIDEANMYHRGDWFWLTHISGLFSLCVTAGLLVKYRRTIEKRELAALCSYFVLPIIGIVFQIFVYGIALLNLMNTLSLLLVFLFIQMEQAEKMKERELELAETRISIMISQIQPHFLYNTLSAVRDLCETDPPKARQAITHFSKYLRGSMRALTQKEPIPFRDELNHIQHYLNLEQMRFEEKLRIVLEIGPMDFMLPALSVQPIVENAVKHGVTCRKSGGTVTLRTEEGPADWVITVEDDGVGFDPAVPVARESEHIGIANVRSRLAGMVGGRLHIESIPGKGTCVKIMIPKEAKR